MCGLGDLKPSRNAQVAELADAYDLGSYVNSCGFKSHLEYQYARLAQQVRASVLQTEGRRFDSYKEHQYGELAHFW